jgi:hypothetical protein
MNEVVLLISLSAGSLLYYYKAVEDQKLDSSGRILPSTSKNPNPKLLIFVC